MIKVNLEEIPNKDLNRAQYIITKCILPNLKGVDYIESYCNNIKIMLVNGMIAFTAVISIDNHLMAIAFNEIEEKYEFFLIKSDEIIVHRKNISSHDLIHPFKEFISKEFLNNLDEV